MIDTLEADLRSTMTAASEHLELPDGMAHDAWIRAQPRDSGWSMRMPRPSGRALAVGGAFSVVVLLVAAFLIGGTTNSKVHHDAAEISPGRLPLQQHNLSQFGTNSTTGSGSSSTAGGQGSPVNSGPGVAAPAPAPSAVANGPSGTTPATTYGKASSAAPGAASSSTGGVGATRVVKTGTVNLTVHKGQVGATVTKLSTLATRLGGYVSQLRTDTIAGSPSGQLTLRVPAGNFEAAVASAATLGRVTSSSTNAHDVTGQYVDLNARLAALKRTRSTYLTILGHATTIGQTLEVQQRVQQTQSQIDRLQGELKLLANQSADGTLSVAVSQVGASTVVVHHHSPSGIGKAWHTSVHRFSRGFDSIVAGLGVVLLIVIIVALVALILGLGYRGARRIADRA